MKAIIHRAQHIKALFLDVDGVFTDGRIYFSSQGEEMRSFHTHDGLGIQRLQKQGIVIAVISGRNSPAVSNRMQELHITLVHQGVEDKVSVYTSLLKTLHLNDQEVAYMGDDLPDIALVQRAGLGIAPSNAVAEVKAAADWVTHKAGGEGAIREVCDLIFMARHA